MPIANIDYNPAFNYVEFAIIKRQAGLINEPPTAVEAIAAGLLVGKARHRKIID